MKINFKWPATTTNGMNPWYAIMWRAVWYVPFLVALSIAALAIAIGWGTEQGKYFWRFNS